MPILSFSSLQGIFLPRKRGIKLYSYYSYFFSFVNKEAQSRKETAPLMLSLFSCNSGQNTHV